MEKEHFYPFIQEALRPGAKNPGGDMTRGNKTRG